MSDKYFLDTNILVYAYDTHDLKKQIRAQSIIKASIRDESGILSAQVLGEFFVVVTRKIQHPLTVDDTEKIIDLLSILPVADIDLALIKKATKVIRDYQISYWDSLIVAAAERMGCSKILTEDLNHGQSYSGVLVENPFL